MLYFLDLHPAFVLRNSASRQQLASANDGMRSSQLLSRILRHIRVLARARTCLRSCGASGGTAAKTAAQETLGASLTKFRLALATSTIWQTGQCPSPGQSSCAAPSATTAVAASTHASRLPASSRLTRRRWREIGRKGTMAKKITAEPWTPRDGRRFHAVAHAYLYII